MDSQGLVVLAPHEQEPRVKRLATCPTRDSLATVPFDLLIAFRTGADPSWFGTLDDCTVVASCGVHAYRRGDFLPFGSVMGTTRGKRVGYLVQDRVADLKLGVQFSEMATQADGVRSVVAVAEPDFGVVELEGPVLKPLAAMQLQQFLCEGLSISKVHTYIQARLSTPHV